MAYTRKKMILDIKQGALHKAMGIPEEQNIPKAKLEVKESDTPLMKKRKVFAQNAKKWKKRGETRE